MVLLRDDRRGLPAPRGDGGGADEDAAGVRPLLLGTPCIAGDVGGSPLGVGEGESHTLRHYSDNVSHPFA